MKNRLPGPDVLSLLWDDAAELSGDFPSINPNLKQVVDQSQDGGQREGGHKQGHKAKLDYCKRKNKNTVYIKSILALLFSPYDQNVNFTTLLSFAL